MWKCENGIQKPKQKNQWNVVKQEENTPNDYEHYGKSKHTPWRNMMWTKALKINITYFNNFCLPAVGT